MALTPLQILELNRRVDKILHAPSNAPAGGQQLEIAFVLDLSADRTYLEETLQDTVRALKAHDRIFQNVRSNIIYCRGEQMTTKVTPMSFIQMGRALEEVEAEGMEPEAALNFEALCAYLKLYHARSRCVFVFMAGKDVTAGRDVTVGEAEWLGIRDAGKAIEGLNPFLKYRLLILTPDKIISGTELLIRLVTDGEG